MNTFKLEVLTPRREFYSGDVEAVTIVLEDGEMTLLKDHEPMLAALEIGEMRIKTADGWKNAFASQGFVEVRPDETLIFVQTCEWPEDIDEARAEETRQRAAEAMRQKLSIIEYKESQAALARSMMRLRVKKHLN
ncbi:MAG: ATP synthase F1 subunit epsilon [Candidatus Avispirillum sp.]